MAVFESLAGVLRALAIGERVKVTLRPETGRFLPIEGHVLEKGESGNFSLKSGSGVIRVDAADILSITRLDR